MLSKKYLNLAKQDPAGSGRAGKQEQEEISRYHVRTNTFGELCSMFGRENVKLCVVHTSRSFSARTKVLELDSIAQNNKGKLGARNSACCVANWDVAQEMERN